MQYFNQKSLNTKKQLSPELHFLIACCQSDPSEDLALNADTPVVKTKVGCDIETIRDSMSILDTNSNGWSDLSALAHRHGIFPLFYRSVKGYADELLSPDITTELKAQNMAIVQRNMLMSAELIRILDLLEKNHIETLAFKGPALAQMAYGDITLRQYVDLDVLVDENHLFRTGELITSNGYIPDDDINFLKNTKLLDVSSDLGFRNTRNSTYIELHWKLFRKKFSKTTDELNIRSNFATTEIQGKKIKTLQPDLLLVYLCAHGSKHMWERIEWVTDIDRLIRNTASIDWEVVWEYAQKLHSINTLLLGLSLSQDLFGTGLPEYIEEKIKSQKNIQLLKTDTLELLSQSNSSQPQNAGLMAMFKKFDYHSKLYDSLWDKTKFYFTIFFKVTPDDALNIDLPKQLYFLYPIIRPFRLIYTRLH